MKTTLNIVGLLLIIYAGAIYWFHNIQRDLLFPIASLQVVSEAWQPRGELSEQTFIDGHCGKLQVAIWRTPEPKGTLLIYHGNGTSLASLDDAIGAYLQLGYNVMSWDYPGYGLSENCYFTQDQLLQDAETVYQWLAKQEKEENIILLGRSLGSGIALSVASRHQHNPVFLVAAYDQMLNVAKDKMLHLIPVKYLFDFPLNTQPWVDAIEQPIYLIHGTEDKIIKPERAKALVESAKGKVKLEWVEGAGHGDDILFSYRNQWLKEKLPQ